MNKDYTAQQKHIRKNYARFPLDLRPEVLEEFKKACEIKGTTPTTEIKRFIASFCEAARKQQRAWAAGYAALLFLYRGGNDNAQTLDVERSS